MVQMNYDTQDDEESSDSESDFITRFDSEDKPDSEDQRVGQIIADKFTNIIQEFRDGQISKSEAGLLLNKALLCDNMNVPDAFFAIFFFFPYYIFIYIIIIYLLYFLNFIAFLLSCFIFFLHAMAFIFLQLSQSLKKTSDFCRNLLKAILTKTVTKKWLIVYKF